MQKSLTERSPYPFGEHVHHRRALFHNTVVTTIYRTGDRTNRSMYPRYSSQVSYSKVHTRLHSVTWYLHLSCCSSIRRAAATYVGSRCPRGIAVLPHGGHLLCIKFLVSKTLRYYSRRSLVMHRALGFIPRGFVALLHGGHLLCIRYTVCWFSVSHSLRKAICYVLGILYVGSQSPIP